MVSYHRWADARPLIDPHDAGSNELKLRCRLWPAEYAELKVIHPEMTDGVVEVPNPDSMLLANVWETIIITLTLGPFMVGIMNSLGGRFAEFSEAAVHKAIDRFITDRKERTDRALADPQGAVPEYIILLGTDGTNVRFSLPLRDAPESRTAAILSLEDVDLGPLGTDELILWWADGTWMTYVEQTPNLRTLTRWDPDSRQWRLYGGQVWRSSTAPPSNEDPD